MGRMPNDLQVKDEPPAPVLLVTGLSGAGKATALKVLEDLGYEAVDNLPLSVPPVAPLPEAPAQEQAALELNHQRLVDGLRRGWVVTSDCRHVGSSAALRAVARDALPQTLHAVSAALLTGDPRPVSETAAWLTDLLAHRGVQSVPAVADLTGTLADTLRDYPLSLDLIRRHFATG